MTPAQRAQPVALESNLSSQESTLLLLLLPCNSSAERVSGFWRAWGWPSLESLLLHSTPSPFLFLSTSRIALV